jgi:hypothetical protein
MVHLSSGHYSAGLAQEQLEALGLFAGFEEVELQALAWHSHQSLLLPGCSLHVIAKHSTKRVSMMLPIENALSVAPAPKEKLGTRAIRYAI